MLLLQTEILTPAFSVDAPLLPLPLAADQSDSPLYLSSLTFRQTPLPQQEQALYYSTSELAFFCRLEVKMEKATKMPVRFRLGDVQQVDYLEGKFSGWRYGY